MLRNLKIRSKLIAVLAIPLVGLVLLAGVGAADRLDAAAAAGQGASFSRLALAQAEAAHQMQVESILSARFLATEADVDEEAMVAQRARTDRALSDLDRALSSLDRSQLSAGDRNAVESAVQGGSDVEVLRISLDRGAFDSPRVPVVSFGQRSDRLIDLNQRVAGLAEDPDLAQGLTTFAALSGYKTLLAEEAAALVPVIVAGTFDNESLSDLRRIITDQQTAQALYQSIAPPAAKQRLRNRLSGPAIGAAERFRTLALAGPDDITGVTVDQWQDAAVAKLNAVHELEVADGQELVAAAGARRSSAETAARLFLLGVGLAVVVALALVALITRAIVGPLRRLTGAAETLSQDHLPRLVTALRNPAEDDVRYLAANVTPVDMAGDDEVGKLAGAINDIQHVAVEVATEQAALLRRGIGDMFVNLARRNQGLLDRQIEFIDQLEDAENDPQALENLYKLDHLATRMRRNAESLLVLAGADPPRLRGKPSPLADVVRAAIGEVGDFVRIDLLSLDEVMVSNAAAPDVAHLLSELMENATNYSPPDTRVEVVGHRTKAEGYVISVTDHGIGMTAEQLSEANELVTHPPLVGLSLSRSLGFIVVGRLAARFDIVVRLMGSPSGGVTAVVSLPPALVTSAAPGAPEVDLVEADRRAGDRGAGDHRSEPLADQPNFLPPFDDLFIDGSWTDEPEPAPATLREALPEGEDFDAGLAALVADDSSRPEPPPTAATPPATEPPSETGVTGPGVTDNGVGPSGPSAHPTGPTGPGGLPTRRPAGASGPLLRSTPSGGGVAPPPAAVSPPAPAAPPPVTAAPSIFGAMPAPVRAEAAVPPAVAGERTEAGLVRRVPGAAGASRAVPGGETTNTAVGSTRRSPDEVRAMLSRYRGGRARGRDDETGTTEAAPPTANPVEEP